jgi:hypothetical protein
MHSRTAVGRAWLFLTALMFLVLQAAILRWVPDTLTAWTVAYVVLVEFFIVGAAYDAATTLLGLLVRPLPIPRREVAKGRQARVALVCTTCDDVDPGTLANLRRHAAGGIAVYVLDDSTEPRARANVAASGLRVVRRETRRGYKAGNLNYWCAAYGDQFDYVVVSDADSRLPVGFVTQMLEYAEHPANADVASFESLISPWNRDTPFADLQAVLTPIEHRFSLGLVNRTAATLSAGHNNLIRLAALRDVGGFDECFLAEDQATTVHLLRRGWRCVTVPVHSHERVPANIGEYMRRQARWAYQTFQLSSLATTGLSAGCALRLAMGLQHHAGPVALLVALSFTIAAALFTPHMGALGRGAYELADVGAWMTLVGLPLGLRTIAGLLTGISPVRQLAVVVFHQIVTVGSAGAIVRRLARAAVSGDRLGFDRTGQAPAPDLRRIIYSTAPGVGLSLLAFIAAWQWWYGVAFVMTLGWFVPAIGAPLLLHRLQNPRRAWL